ncbi:aldo-keto reductase [Trichoderma sp. SZMC 28014]
MGLPTIFPLNSGNDIPAVGLGTFQGDEGNAFVKEAVKKALQLGYRHIDGAHAYGNEKQIGQAIKESGVPRHEIFVTTKLAQTWHEPADVRKALEQSLKDLQTEYVDLYLMHFPHAYKAGENNGTIRHPSGNGKPVIDYDLSRRYTETWQAMEQLVDLGLARSIGLSNFNILKTKRVVDVARIMPAVNQVEIHPYLPQQELFEFSSQHNILLMAHQPLGGRPVGVVRGSNTPPPTADSKIIEIAARYQISPAQVCLSWAVQRGIPVIPKSVQDAHLQQNIQLTRLSDEDFRAVDQLSSEHGSVRYLDPSQHLGFDIFDEENDQPVANSAPWD